MADEKKPAVLIADDEKHIRLLLKTVMASMNFTIAAEAANGEEAVQLFKELGPDLVLMDVNMPFKSGEAALSEIIAGSPGAIVIMLTSVAEKESVEKCIGLGASGYVRKDTPLAELKAIILDTWNTYKK
ncbi:MAG: response regulator transcription factor [Nitrospirae bacterium]|nr:response regulator transcription factor [Nitrospirota bacterium]